MFSTDKAEFVEQGYPCIANNIFHLLRLGCFLEGAGDVEELEEEVKPGVKCYRQLQLNLGVPFGICAVM